MQMLTSSFMLPIQPNWADLNWTPSAPISSSAGRPRANVAMVVPSFGEALKSVFAASMLPAWDRIEDAFALATFVVVTRPGHPAPDESSLPGPIVHLEIPQLRVSSTELRERFANGGATRFLVPVLVDQEVRRRGLYGTGPSA